MRAVSRFLLAVLLTMVLLTAHAGGAWAADTAAETLAVRWVMAGIAKDADSPAPVALAPKTTLRTGDKIKMYLRAVNKCFFYLFYQDTEGRLQLIYPGTLPSQALESGGQLTVPQGNHWFELDDQTGTETFHVLISPSPLNSIEALYEDYQQRASGTDYAAARVITAIERLRDNQRPLTSKAERPISIGGTFRGAAKKGIPGSLGSLDHLAEDITTANVFCRTYTIEHH